MEGSSRAFLEGLTGEGSSVDSGLCPSSLSLTPLLLTPPSFQQWFVVFDSTSPMFHFEKFQMYEIVERILQ